MTGGVNEGLIKLIRQGCRGKSDIKHWEPLFSRVIYSKIRGKKVSERESGEREWDLCTLKTHKLKT